MDRNNIDRFYADNIGLIHTVARKGYGRLMGIGAAIDYEDLVQELSEVFIKAYNGFDADTGKFSTYFTVAAGHKISQIAEGYELDRLGVKTTRFESDEINPQTGKRKWKSRRDKIHGGTASVEEMTAHLPEEDGGTFLDIIDSGAATPEQLVSAQQDLDQMLGSLSPLASKIMEMTINPPAFIEHELMAAEAHVEFARSEGINRRHCASISVSFVAGVLEKTAGLPVQTIRAAKREIFELARNI